MDDFKTLISTFAVQFYCHIDVCDYIYIFINTYFYVPDTWPGVPHSIMTSLHIHTVPHTVHGTAQTAFIPQSHTIMNASISDTLWSQTTFVCTAASNSIRRSHSWTFQTHRLYHALSDQTDMRTDSRPVQKAIAIYQKVSALAIQTAQSVTDWADRECHYFARAKTGAHQYTHPH